MEAYTELNLAPNVQSEIQQFQSVTQKKSSGSPRHQKPTHEAKTVHCSRLSRIGNYWRNIQDALQDTPAVKLVIKNLSKKKFSGMHCKKVQVAFQHFPADKLV